MKLSNTAKFLILFALFIIAALLSLFFGGSESISWATISDQNFIFYQIRLPKTITAVVAGASLAVAGLILQIIFRNPLAGPYVLGISSGASLAVAIGVLSTAGLSIFSEFIIGKSFVAMLAILGSFAATILVLSVSKRVSSNVILLLIGLMLAQIFGAMQMALEYFSDPGNLKSFVIWGMGSLANCTNSDLLIYLPATAVCFIVVIFFIKPLNAFLLGPDYAQNLGVNFIQNRFYLILISSVLTGLTTAFCGPIAFVGIAVPVLARIIFNTSRQEIQLLACCFLGSVILLLSDAMSHTLVKNVTLPINMITTFIGAPLVIYLMYRSKHW